MSVRAWWVGAAVLVSLGMAQVERRFLPVEWRKTVVLEGTLDSGAMDAGRGSSSTLPTYNSIGREGCGSQIRRRRASRSSAQADD